MKTFRIRKRKPFRFPLGKRGEMIAWNYLSRRGYRVLERNYRCKMGEIDAVAEKNGRLVFIEVKTRRDHRLGRPEEAVDRRKQAKLIKLAAWYRQEKRMENFPVSFDVLAVTFGEGLRPQFRLIENAFNADQYTL